MLIISPFGDLDEHNTTIKISKNYSTITLKFKNK